MEERQKPGRQAGTCAKTQHQRVSTIDIIWKLWEKSLKLCFVVISATIDKEDWLAGTSIHPPSKYPSSSSPSHIESTAAGLCRPSRQSLVIRIANHKKRSLYFQYLHVEMAIWCDHTPIYLIWHTHSAYATAAAAAADPDEPSRISTQWQYCHRFAINVQWRSLILKIEYSDFWIVFPLIIFHYILAIWGIHCALAVCPGISIKCRNLVMKESMSILISFPEYVTRLTLLWSEDTSHPSSAM